MMDNWRQYNDFGLWHDKAGTYAARTATDGYDHYPNNFICRVQIKHLATGEIYERKGSGRFIGNFSPVWVNFLGRSWQLDELLREGW
jgi:hypothetical protein